MPERNSATFPMKALQLFQQRCAFYVDFRVCKYHFLGEDTSNEECTSAVLSRGLRLGGRFDELR
jgi:hypothetical protein